MKQKGFSTTAILGIMAIFIVVFGLGIFFMPQIKSALQVSSPSSQSSQTTVTGKYVEQVVDLAPSMPAAQKTAVVIEKSDSSVEKVLLPTASVDTYIAGLPAGTKVISKTPLSVAK